MIKFSEKNIPHDCSIKQKTIMAHHTLITGNAWDGADVISGLDNKKGCYKMAAFFTQFMRHKAMG